MGERSKARRRPCHRGVPLYLLAMSRRRRLVLAAFTVALLVVAGALAWDWLSPRPALPPSWEKGFNVTSYEAQAFSKPVSHRALRALRRTGTTRVAFATAWYMDDLQADTIASDPEATPSDVGLVHMMRFARTLGFEVTLKPQVDTRANDFRGRIRPRDPAAWFASYRRMIAHHAALARRGGAGTLVVGVELTSMARYERQFRRVIRVARSRFPGRLTFAANGVEGARQVQFWDALDVIGIDAYLPLSADDPDPGVDAMVDAWRQRWIPSVRAVRRRWRKPVLFIELGYESRLGTAMSPDGAHGPTSDEAQARAYEAAFRAWAGEPGFLGIYWWNWAADRPPRENRPDGFSPQHKPAEAVVRAYHGAG